MAKEIVVGIIKLEDKILLIRRKKQEGNLYWQFPGGEIEDSETEQQAIERELLEELGINCKASIRLGERIHPETKRNISYWACQYLSGDLQILDTEEIDKAEWVSKDDLYDKISSSIYEPVISYINEDK